MDQVSDIGKTAQAWISGSQWQADELNAIVADYFDMLSADLSGVPYIKSHHRKELATLLGRSHGSIEFKYQNISAVLDELGATWIPGYKPAKHYQSAIFDAIDIYLTQHPQALEPTLQKHREPDPIAQVFVAPPSVREDTASVPEQLRHLVRKYDPVERDHRNRSLGRAGEAFVLDLEKRRLHEKGRVDLVDKVRWIAEEEGDGAGYDILSFDLTGNERLLEVKTTNGSARTPFFLSRNECAVASERPGHWQLYRVHLFAKRPRLFTLTPPLEAMVTLTTESWRASF